MRDSVEKIIEEMRSHISASPPQRRSEALKDWANRLAALSGQAAQTAAPWQPIETAPRDGTRVILAWDDKSIVGFFLDNGARFQFWRVPSLELQPSGQPTHWMPLPAPPDSKEPSTKCVVGTWVPVYERQPTFIQHTLVKDRNGHLGFAGFNGKYWHNGYQRVTHIVEWFDEMQIVLANPHEETVRKAFAYHAAMDSKEPAVRVKGSGAL